MGVPALFRWLAKKYPKIISPVIEEKPVEIDNGDGTTTKIPIDARKANPNGEEVDNLYLDMNGIVHPCSHPEDRPPPANEEEMMIAIFEYTDRIINMVRPRKLLMIAVDGVAPRAKMNQQRSRRFRSAQDAAEKDAAAEEHHASLVARGAEFQDGEDDKPKKTWDSNSITPGTPFMDILAQCLRYWVRWKQNTDPAWEKLKTIISDATVPGEGEHKIMNFIRSQRSSATHDPNTRHVIYGLDADLIMLGIATHEPHFRVLREDVFANDTKPGHCRKCNQPGHMADNCRGNAKREEGVDKMLKPFIWLHVGVLREYLAIEMAVPNQPFAFSLERALDDWVFMCFFVGNDFLPHLPSLDIREDGIDTLIAIWRDNIPIMGGYVTKDGHVDLARVQVILKGLAQQESAIFKSRREVDLRREAAAKRRAEQAERRESKRLRTSDGPLRGDAAMENNPLPRFAPGQAQTRNDPRYAATAHLTHADIVGNANKANKSAAAVLKEQLANSKKADETEDRSGQTPVLGKRSRSMIEDANDEPSTPGRNTPVTGSPNRGTSGALGGNSQPVEGNEDTVKLWEDGYQARYYEQKFHVSPDDVEFRHKVAASYVEGLCWVLLYYFQGVPSWTWYYPYHYAPFAEDFVGLATQMVKFDKGKAFRPYEQLMGVMPPASKHTIPSAFHPLMEDEDSPIKKFYPVDFAVDMNGKKFAWQGVALLPFIDETRLLSAMATKYPLLTSEEHRRNEFGNEVLIFSAKHPMSHELITNFYGKKKNNDAARVPLNVAESQGLAGKVGKEESYAPNTALEFPLGKCTQDAYTSLDVDETVTVSYHMPVYPGTHKSIILPGIKWEAPMLDWNDIQTTRERSYKSGRNFNGVPLPQQVYQSPFEYESPRRNYGPPHRGSGGSPPSGPRFSRPLPPSRRDDGSATGAAYDRPYYSYGSYGYKGGSYDKFLPPRHPRSPSSERRGYDWYQGSGYFYGGGYGGYRGGPGNGGPRRY